jgi:predicted DNA binding CopG/RHH family protein
MEKHNENCIDIVYTTDMAKSKTDFQVNTRWNEEDLAFVKAKADRMGWNLSQFIKAAALNAEFTIQMQEDLRKPKL